MFTKTRCLLVATSAAVVCVGFFFAVPATINAFPVVPDENTVILDDLNGVTVGNPVGGLQFLESQPGFDQAGEFGGSNYVQYQFPSPNSDEGTIEMWVKPERRSPSGVNLIDINWNDTTSYPPAGHIMILGMETDGQLVFSVWPPQGTLSSVSAISPDEWTHVAVSWGPTISRLYVNGTAEDSAPVNFRPAFISTNYAYLDAWGGDSAFDGLIDEFHLSKIQRTDSEVLLHATVPEPSTGVLFCAMLFGLFGVFAEYARGAHPASLTNH